MFQSSPGLDIEMTSTDELDWCGKEEEEGVLHGEAGDQAIVVGVLMTRSGHLDHVVLALFDTQIDSIQCLNFAQH